MKKPLPESTQKMFLRHCLWSITVLSSITNRRKKQEKAYICLKGTQSLTGQENLFDTFIYTNVLYTNTLYHITRLKISNHSNLTVNRPLLVLQKFRQTRSLEMVLIKDSLEGVYHKAFLEGYPSCSHHTTRSPSTVRGSHNNFSNLTKMGLQNRSRRTFKPREQHEERKSNKSAYYLYSIFAKRFNQNIIIRKLADKSKQKDILQNTSCTFFKNTSVTKHRPGVSYIKETNSLTQYNSLIGFWKEREMTFSTSNWRNVNIYCILDNIINQC